MDARSLGKKSWCKQLPAPRTHPPHTSMVEIARLGRQCIAHRRTTILRSQAARPHRVVGCHCAVLIRWSSLILIGDVGAPAASAGWTAFVEIIIMRGSQVVRKLAAAASAPWPRGAALEQYSDRKVGGRVTMLRMV